MIAQLVHMEIRSVPDVRMETMFYAWMRSRGQERLNMLPRKHYAMVVRTELEEIEFQLGNLRNEVEQSGDEAKAEYKELISLLFAKLEQAKAKLRSLELASEEQWEKVKTDLDNTRDVLKTMWSDAMSQITA
jgi:hypothetical protein